MHGTLKPDGGIRSNSRIRIPPSSRLGAVAAGIVLIVAMLGGCSSTPRILPEAPSPKSPSYTQEPPPGNRLAMLSEQLLGANPAGDSGFLMLESNADALKWRLLLADLAEETLDMQYYEWKGDASADLLLARLLRAADRGVRVRILVDDILLMGSDPAVAALNRHPRIEVRLFNPRAGRNQSTIMRALEFVGNIEELNHRMHNKMFLVDNRLAIMGGRNIGNEYFGLNPEQNFVDFDILTLGEVIPEIAKTFDLFWNSEWVYPGVALLKHHSDPSLLEELRDELKVEIDDNRDLLTAFQDHALDPTQMLEELQANLYTGTADVVYDQPLVGAEQPPMQLIESLREVRDRIQSEILVVSPYFIPDGAFYETMPALTAKGVRLSVVTNSLAATNHPIVYSGYKKHRLRVLDTGATLFEFRRDAAPAVPPDTPPVAAEGYGLHAKLIVMDRRFVFAGSLNLDPRSIYLNTEVGLLIDSEELAEAVRDLFENLVAPENSWQVLNKGKNRLVWQSGPQIRTSPPPSSFGRRFQSWFFGLFTLDKHL